MSPSELKIDEEDIFDEQKKNLAVFAAFVGTAIITAASGCASTETVESTRIGADRIYQDYRVPGNR